MNKKLILPCLVIISLALVQCSHTHHLQPTENDKGLKDYYKNYFPIGVAVSARSLKDPEEKKLILQQFNSLTPENDMKMGPIHPRRIIITGKMLIRLLLLLNAII
jgi:endo-1,4-beta-xylanase